MSFINFTKIYFIALPILIGLDALWLGFVARGFYKKHIGFLMRPDFNIGLALLFYLLYIAGLIFFVIAPGLDKSTILQIFLKGAFFGLIAYATYDLTSGAIIKDWPGIVTVVDIAWGAFASGVISSVVFWLTRFIV